MPARGRPDKVHWVYGLADPRTEQIMYIGVSVNIAARYFAHVSEGKSVGKKHRGRVYKGTDKARWISSLLAEGFPPSLVLLEETDAQNAIACERKWMYRLGARYDLVNSDIGFLMHQGLIEE